MKSGRKFIARRIKSSGNTQVRQNSLCEMWEHGEKKPKQIKGKYTKAYFAIFSKNNLNTFLGKNLYLGSTSESFIKGF